MSKARFEYDVGLFYIGEQSDYVREVANDLRSRNIRVYSDNKQVSLWDTELNDLFSDLYQDKCHYCVIFISIEFVRDIWPNVEHRSTQARDMVEWKNTYVLPVRLDGLTLSGIPNTNQYIDIENFKPLELSEFIAIKIGKMVRENYLPTNLNRLFERLDVSEELEIQEQVRNQATAFFGSLRNMNKAERHVVISLVNNGCPAGLPDEIHIHSDLLRRQTGKSINQLKRLLGGIASLGFRCWIEEGCNKDVKTISNNNLFFHLTWVDLTAYDELPEVDDYPEMLVVKGMMEVVSGYYCEKHSLETLKSLDFSQLSDETIYSEYNMPD